MKNTIELVPNQFDATEMWADDLYFMHVDTVVRALVKEAEIFFSERNVLMVRNDVNIFTLDFGFPSKVSFPRKTLAERLAKDAKGWTDTAIDYSSYQYLREHQYLTFKNENAYVVSPANLAHGSNIQTQRIRVDVAWR